MSASVILNLMDYHEPKTKNQGQRPKDKTPKTMSTLTVEEAQAKLSEVIDTLAPGEEVIITRN